MLVISRRVGEIIVIGDPRNPTGRIHVKYAHDGRASLVFDFPRDIEINRDEVAKKKAMRPPA